MFGLTEEQESLRKEVRAIAAKEVAPHVFEWDEASIFPAAVVKKLGAMGLMGVIFPEELGGAGMGYLEYVLAIEELSRVDGSVGIIVASHNSLCTNHIMLGGSDEQRKRWIPKLASGQWLGAWVGSHMVLKRGTKFIRPVFLTMVVLITLKVMWDMWLKPE